MLQEGWGGLPSLLLSSSASASRKPQANRFMEIMLDYFDVANAGAWRGHKTFNLHLDARRLLDPPVAIDQ